MGFLYRNTLVVSGLLVAFWLLLPNQAATQEQGEAQKLDARIDALIKMFGEPEPQSENQVELDLNEKTRAVQELANIGKPAVPKLLSAILESRKAIADRNNVEIKKWVSIAALSGTALDKIGPLAVEQMQARWLHLTETDKWIFMDFRGKYDYTGALDFALTSLDSKAEHVRGYAINYFRIHHEVKARGKLLTMLNKTMPIRHRWAIIDDLAEIPNEDVGKAFEALLDPKSWLAKGEGQPLPHSFYPPYWPDGHPLIIKALAKMGYRQAAPKMLEVVHEKQINDKAYLGLFVFPVLAEWAFKKCVPELREIYNVKSEFSGNAGRWLFQMGDRLAFPEILYSLEKGKIDTRRDTCRLVAEYGIKQDVLILGKCLDDPDVTVRLTVCRGLERITGATFRLPGQTNLTLGVEPAWKAWIEENKDKFIFVK